MKTSHAAATPKLLVAILVIGAALVPISMYAIFGVAPVEAKMGIVQKLFYFHFSTWQAMYVGFGVCALCSAVYLHRRDERWDAVAVAGGEVGMLFCVIGLITGPFWARKSWGVWWAWDPRLTTTLLIAMIFFAYLLLRGFGSLGEVEKRFAASLAIIGILDIPVIKYSVERWSGTHPMVLKSGGIHPDMVPALASSLALFLVLVAALIWVRVRIERMRQRVAALELEAVERGWSDDY